MDLREIATHRLTSQQMISTDLNTAMGLVKWFGAVQAQEYAQTKWGLGLRLSGSKDSDIEAAFISGNILRTHVLRPTWHFVSAEDIHWLLALTAPRVHAANAYMYRKLELDNALFHTCNDLIVKCLEGNKYRTRDDINETFRQHKIVAQGHRLSYIMMQAELDGIICSGPRQGNQFTYTLLEERVPKHKPKSREEALPALTQRYFQSRGPATVKDFSTWSGLTLSDCKKGVDMLQPDLEKHVIEKETYYSGPLHSMDKEDLRRIQLLPIYDEFIMGYKNRDAILEYHKSIHPKPAFRFDNTIVAEGQIIGNWKRTVYPKYIDLEYHFFKQPDKSQLQDFERAVQRFEEFTGLKIVPKKYI